MGWNARAVSLAAAAIHRNDHPTPPPSRRQPRLCQHCGERDERKFSQRSGAARCHACFLRLRAEYQRLRRLNRTAYGMSVALDLPQCKRCDLKHQSVEAGRCSYCRREEAGERLLQSVRECAA